MKNIENGSWIVPQPILIIGAYDKDGKPIAKVAHGFGQADQDEIMFCIDFSGKEDIFYYSDDFSVSFATEETVISCDYVRIASCNVDSKVIEKTGWRHVNAEFVNAPIFLEFPLSMECKVINRIEKGKILNITAKILNTKCKEEILKDGSPDIQKMNLITYEPYHKKILKLGSCIGTAYHDGRCFSNLLIEKINKLSKYRTSDCFIAPQIDSGAMDLAHKEFDIEKDETILLVRDTSFWSNGNQGVVITDKGIYRIEDNKKKDERKFIGWGFVENIKAGENNILFYDENKTVIADINVYSFVKKESDQQLVANELVDTFMSISSIFKKDDAEQRAAEVEKRKKTRLFYNNFYTPFGSVKDSATKFSSINYFKIDNGVMVVNTVPSSKINVNGLWRVMYITESEVMGDTVIYAKIPGLNVLRYIFNYAKTEDAKFNHKAFPALTQALSNDFTDSGIRMTKRKINGKNMYLLAMNINKPYSEICNSDLTRDLSHQIK